MKLNWYVLKYLFNDDGLDKLKADKDKLNADLTTCEFDRDSYAEEIADLNNELITANRKLARYEKSNITTVDIDFDRITNGRLAKDKPSPHSPLTFEQMKQIVKNIVATDKTLYMIELWGDTNSMEPDIDDNTLLVAMKYNPKEHTIAKEDIVHYYNKEWGGRVLHRVIDVQYNSRGEKKYFIRGDNNPWADGWFKDEDIIGICCGKIWGKENDGETND